MPDKSIKAIQAAVDDLFDKVKYRFLGSKLFDKQLKITINDGLTLPAMMEAAAEGEPSKKTVQGVLRVAESYLDAQRERSKATILKEVLSFLQEAELQEVETDLTTVLAGKLSAVWEDITNRMSTIADTELQSGKAMSTVDTIVKLAAENGITDPTVCMLTARDGLVCGECTRLHLLPDGITPRAWKLSEMKAGYHKKGDPTPSLSSLHPRCRCTCASIPPGFGFVGGQLSYISPDHDEWSFQRQLSKALDYNPHTCPDC